MKSDFVNKANVDGYVFSHSLKEKVSGPDSKNPGTKFISGRINVAVDEELISVVPVNFVYVTETYKNGNANDTYKLLKEIIDTNRTVNVVGKDNAIKISVQGRVECNDFIGRDENLVTTKQISGAFAHYLPANRPYRATFETDMLITNYQEKEVEDGEDYGVINGYVFNFRNDFMPVSYNVRPSCGGMQYFDDMDISNENLLLTRVWGDVNTMTIERKTESETAFGTAVVVTTPSTLHSWDIAGASVEPYDFGSEETMTMNDIKLGMANREVALAAIRSRYEERKNAAKSGSFAASVSTASAAPSNQSNVDFKF